VKIHVLSHFIPTGGRERVLTLFLGLGHKAYAAKFGDVVDSPRLLQLGGSSVSALSSVFLHLVRSFVLRLRISSADFCHDPYTALVFGDCAVFLHSLDYEYMNPVVRVFLRGLYGAAIKGKPCFSMSPFFSSRCRWVLPPFYPPLEPCPPRRGGVVLGYHGRLAAQKGLRELVALARVLEGAGVEVRVRVLGDGPLRDWLRGAGVEVLPPVRGLEGVREFLCSLTHYVHLSKSETFSYSVYEAASVGLPLILSPIPVFKALYGGCACFVEKPADVLRCIERGGGCRDRAVGLYKLSRRMWEELLEALGGGGR